jgi:hypothetical protein
LGFLEEFDYRALDEFDAVFEASTIRKGTVDPPNGYYSGYVDDFQVFKASNDRWYLKIVIVLLSPGWEGHLIIKNTILDLTKPKMTARRIKSDLTTLGYDWKGIRSLGDQRKWEQVCGRSIEFKVTHKDGNKHRFMNIWISRSPGRVSKETRDLYRRPEPN